MRSKLILILSILLFAPLSGCVEPGEQEEENSKIWIQWTNVDDCDFSIKLEAKEGQMYNKWVDYADRVTWEGANVTGPFTFTLTNLESYAECYTIQRLYVYGEEVEEWIMLQPKEQTILTIN